MDIFDIHAWIDTNKARYIRLYGLEQWDIKVVVDDAEDASLMGACEPEFEYKQATIFIYSELIDSEQELIETFLHEVEHILLSPFDIYQRIVEAQLPKGRSSMTSEFFDVLNEQSRNMLGQFRMNVLGLQQENLEKQAAENNTCGRVLPETNPYISQSCIDSSSSARCE